MRSLQPTGYLLGHSTVHHNFEVFVQLSHKILRNQPLGNDPYLEYSCHIAQEFALGNRTRVIVNMPPGFAKTTIFSICLIAWLLAHDPTLRIIFVTHDASLAREVASAVRKIMKSEEYRRIFAVRIERGYDTVDDFRTTAGGRLFACSIRGGITGRRADVVIVDDPLAIKYAGKLKKIHKVNEVFDKEIVTRLSDPTHGRVMVVMHRLHKEDLTAHLMQKGGYDRIALPLVAERAREYRFGGLVWPRAKGEQLRLGLYSKKKLRELREEEGKPGFRLLYQQGIGPETGFSIKPKHFRLVDPRGLPPELPVVFSIDTSQKERPESSWNVILVMVRFGNDDIVLDEFCARCDYVSLYGAFHDLADEYHPSAVVIEDTSNGSALISQLQDEGEFRIEPVTPKGSKSKRLRRHMRRIRKGRIHLPTRADWFGKFVGEFVDFPDGATDRIDAMTMYWDFMATNPVLLSHVPRDRARSLPAGVGSRGPIRLVSSRPDMEIRGAVLRTASSVLRGPSTLMERPPERTILTEPRREPITVIISTAEGPIRMKI
jgi:predicted phage terminase large subunit-like protein